MRSDWIIGSVTAGLVLGGLVAAGPAAAESKSKQVDTITCEEFLALNPNDQNKIAFWVDDCKATPKETLWQKLKKHL